LCIALPPMAIKCIFIKRIFKKVKIQKLSKT